MSAIDGKQRVALVTGGARRVGREIVLRLHRAAFKVCFTYYRSAEDAAVLAKEIDGLAIPADLTRPESSVPEIARAFSERFGRLDVLVNNASIFSPGDLSQVSVDRLRAMNAIHVEGPLLLCQHFAPVLKDTRGHVVNLLDLLAEKPWPEYLAYCASKAALANLTISLARALAPEVTVNGIAPGVVAWPADYPEAARQKYLARVPLGRAGTPADVAELVHFLATAGSYITGQVIRVDGGRSTT